MSDLPSFFLKRLLDAQTRATKHTTGRTTLARTQWYLIQSIYFRYTYGTRHRMNICITHDPVWFHLCSMCVGIAVLLSCAFSLLVMTGLVRIVVLIEEARSGFCGHLDGFSGLKSHTIISSLKRWCTWRCFLQQPVSHSWTSTLHMLYGMVDDVWCKLPLWRSDA